MNIHLNGEGIDGLASKLAALGQKAASAVNDMLINGSDVLIDGLKSGCDEYGHNRTGGLRNSINRKAAPKVTEDGGEVVVTFVGADEHGTRYGEIAAYLNHGTSKISADHWVDNTVERVMPAAKRAMSDTLNAHLGK